ncbi:X-Pro dipeptidyl-peptidase [Allocatelliglobosispora scoriae]|uniref:Xaa-Pro dipeptidyl-peptidase n=1 Tax=Allocatelliglobosispora scoriae TaxID=643052 RepID=A0A841BQ02_9ACTN|nr:CocE/NonD family hydrolase [Allocatelliglobosispora scoriae]MBB5868911.1 X-Pro dipeptidyl-peptidase [Allocatelliglobosispora scoriae]
MKRVIRCLTVVAMALGGSAIAAPADAGAVTDAARPPHLLATETVPVYSYATAIREVVWVQSPVDSDNVGGFDRIAVDIVRPNDPTQPTLRVPAIIDASPYYRCCGRGNENEKKTYANPNDPASPVAKVPLYYDNYFVPRGYAFLAVDLAGTARSTGCADAGGVAEVLGAKAVVQWLNGTASAFRADGTQVFATWFAGRAGMIGKSWDGAIATGVAATGVTGLATIVPISAVTSWYDYERLNGAEVSGVSSMSSLHSLVTARPAGTCTATINKLAAGGASSAISYTPFWAERDYVASAASVQASVLAVHGMNDLNVKPSNFGLWWQQLVAHDVPRKLWLSQEGHVDPFDFRRSVWVDTLHRWFDQWLYGLDTGIMNEPQATVERGADVWAESSVWPPAGTTESVFNLRPGNGTTGELTLSAPVAGTVNITDVKLSEASAVANPANAVNGRKVFQTGPLTAPLHIAGGSTITLMVKVTKPTTALTARLVDYGTLTRVNWESSGSGIATLANQTCWGDSTAADDACYKETQKVTVSTGTSGLTRGWLDAAHRDSLSAPTPVPANVWQTITWRLHDTDQVIPAGHRLALVIGGADGSWTTTSATGAVITVDLARSLLRLPVAP